MSTKYIVNNVSGQTINGDLTINGGFKPTTDNQYDLGNLNNRWKSIYIGEGTVYITDTVTGNLAGLTNRCSLGV